MSITARPGDTFTAVLTGAPQGLVGTLTLGIRELPSESVVSPQATAGITETVLGDSTSNYSGERTAPTDTSKLYEVVWVNGATELTEDLHLSGFAAPAELLPTVDEVAALLTARTVDDGGNTVGTFTDATTPTGAQVTDLIDKAWRDVRRELGPEVADTDDDSLKADLRDLTALRVAMYVELSYYPEQANEDGSVYQQYLAMWLEGVRSLAATLRSDPGDTQSYGTIAVTSPTRASIAALPPEGSELIWP